MGDFWLGVLSLFSFLLFPEQEFSYFNSLQMVDVCSLLAGLGEGRKMVGDVFGPMLSGCMGLGRHVFMVE